MKAASIPFQVTNTPAIIGDGNVDMCLNTLWTFHSAALYYRL